LRASVIRDPFLISGLPRETCPSFRAWCFSVEVEKIEHRTYDREGAVDAH